MKKIENYLEINPQNVNQVEELISNDTLLKSSLHIYVRVSTKGQEEGFSLSDQIKEGLKIGKNFGTSIVWNEKGKTSKSEILEVRPVLTKLVNMIEKGKIRKLFVLDMTRLSRNDFLSGKLKSIFYKHGVNVYMKGGTIFNLDSIQDKFMYSILSSVSEYDNDVRRMKSVMGKISKVEKGLWCGGMISFGYKVIDDNIKLNRKESVWVKKIFNWYNEGKTLKYIQTELMKNNVLTRRNNPIWNTGSISSLLTKTTYIGYNNYTFRTDSRKLGGEVRKFKIPYPKIIKQKLWDSVQIKIQSYSSRSKMIYGGVRENNTLLQSLLFCDGCGKLMGRRIKKDKGKNDISTYNCRTLERYWNNPKIHPKCECNKSMNIEKTDKLIWGTILKVWKNSYYIKEEFKKKIIDDVIKKRNNTDFESNIKKQEKLQNTYSCGIERNKKLISDLEDEYYSGKLKDESRYNEIKDSLLNKIDELKTNSSNIDELIFELEDDKKWIDWLKIFDDEYKSISKFTELSDKKKFLQKYVERINVSWDKETKIHMFRIQFIKPINIDNRIKLGVRKFSIKKGEKILDIKPEFSIRRKDRKKEYTKRKSYNKSEQGKVSEKSSLHNYSTVTDFAKFLGISTLQPLINAI